VADYLKSTTVKIPNAQLFNGSNAGYPDVSMHAENFVLAQYGVPGE
jgi:hypothetical protein